jgi:uncharacterized protein YbjT (DUF2867 family)
VSKQSRRGATDLAVVTGAFSYSGYHITKKLLDNGTKVRTITGHPERPNPFEGEVRAHPLQFDNPTELTASLEGARALYNTYWIRFPFGDLTFERAVDNSITLFDCAKRAGVKKVVHISITNPSLDSPFPYFRGKAEVENALTESGLAYTIVRPTVLFGGRDVLINNIAWLLRSWPVFGIPGSGKFPMQPVHVDDQAELCVKAGASNGENEIFDAAGPETYTFEEIVVMIRHAIDSRAALIKVPVVVALNLSRAMSLLTGDLILTKDEMQGLIAGLIVSGEEPRGKTSFAKWLNENADSLGRSYASELQRHYRSGPSLPFSATQ